MTIAVEEKERIADGVVRSMRAESDATRETSLQAGVDDEHAKGNESLKERLRAMFGSIIPGRDVKESDPAPEVVDDSKFSPEERADLAGHAEYKKRLADRQYLTRNDGSQLPLMSKKLPNVEEVMDAKKEAGLPAVATPKDELTIDAVVPDANTVVQEPSAVDMREGTQGSSLVVPENPVIETAVAAPDTAPEPPEAETVVEATSVAEAPPVVEAAPEVDTASKTDEVEGTTEEGATAPEVVVPEEKKDENTVQIPATVKAPEPVASASDKQIVPAEETESEDSLPWWKKIIGLGQNADTSQVAGVGPNGPLVEDKKK